MKDKVDLIRQYCLIQLQVLNERENRLRKDLVDVKIQREYLTQLIAEIEMENVFKDLNVGGLLKVAFRKKK